MRLMPSFVRNASSNLSLDEQNFAVAASTHEEAEVPHQELASEYSSLMEQFGQIELLKTRFSAAVSKFGRLSTELDTARLENSELRAAYEGERSQSAELREKLSRLEPELAASGEAKASLIARIERLSVRLEGLEGEVERQKIGHQEVSDALLQKAEKLDAAKSHIDSLQEELAAARSELEQRAGRFASREVEFESMASALHHAEAQERLFKNLLDESTEQNARLSRQLREFEPNGVNYKAQIAQLQSALEAERFAKEQASAERMDGIDLLRGEMKNANTRLEAALARADAHERMLNDSRANYREKLEELRLSERRAVDLGIQLSNAQRRAEMAENENAGAHTRLARLEAERSHFSAHLETMTKALAEKDATIVLAHDRTTFVSARLEECQRAARAERERFEADLAAIAHLFDGERVDRALLDGTVQSARQQGKISILEAKSVAESTPMMDTVDGVVVPYRVPVTATAGE